MKFLLFITIIMLIVNNLWGEVLDRIIAKVGNDIILESELTENIKHLEGMGVLPEGIGKIEVLEDMIESRLVLQTAKRSGYEVDEFRIRTMVDSQINSLISRFGSESALRRELELSGLTLSDLRSRYREIITEQRLKEQIINSEIMNKVFITDAMIEDFYEEEKDMLPLRPEMKEIGMIVLHLGISEETEQKIKNNLVEIRDSINRGTDFAKMAIDHSDCPSSARGGDLGFFGRGMMVSEFEEALFKLRLGEVSEIVQTQFGFHLIKLEEILDDEIRVRHILKRTEPTEDDIAETNEKMQNILNQLRGGSDFGKMAQQYSQDESGLSGGVIGQFSADNYPELFRDVIKPLEIGEYSEVIREGESLYIFTKTRSIPEQPYTFDELREEIEEHLSEKIQMQLYDEWIDELKSKTYIEILF